jgi:hypothetical protein
VHGTRQANGRHASLDLKHGSYPLEHRVYGIGEAKNTSSDFQDRARKIAHLEENKARES